MTAKFMFPKFLNGQSKTITSAAVIIGGATLASRLVGLARDRIFAHYYGAGPVMDAYYAAFKIPDLVYNLLIIGALSAGFIPAFTRLFAKEETKSAAWKLANNVLNIIAISLIVLSGLGIIFAPKLMPLVAPGFSDEVLAMTIKFSRIMFGSTILLGMSMVIGGILQSMRCFFLYSLSPIFYNLGIIIGAIFLTDKFGVTGLAWGVVLGAFLHFILQTYSAVANGYRWHWIFDWRDKETREIGKLMLPRTMGLAISQLNAVIITLLASLLPIGSVAIFNYANNLQAVPIGIIGISFAVAVFPVLSVAVAREDKEGFIRHLSQTIRQILFLIIPISVIMMLLRAQIVRVVLGSGAFDWSATIHTANALALFSFSLFAQSLIPLFARAFYALSNTKTPFVIGVIAELVSIIAALILMKPLGVSGLALATSIGAVVNFILLAFAMRGVLKSLDEITIFSSLTKIAVATLPMAVAVQILKYPLAMIFDQQYFWGIFGQGLVAGVVGLVIYGAMCYILKLPEFLLLRNSLKRRLLKVRNIENLDEGVEMK